MRTFRFRALVALGESVPDVPASHYPAGGHMVMAHASRPGQPGSSRDFPAALCRDDEAPLRPGDRAVVTITVAGDQAGSYFGPGRRFTLWAGADIGHGVISRRVFCSSGPC